MNDDDKPAEAANHASPQSSRDTEAAGQDAFEPMLTPRERQVLELIVQGGGGRSIAHQLGLSVRTVDVYRSHLKMKLRTKSLADLAKIALSRGLCPQLLVSVAPRTREALKGA